VCSIFMGPASKLSDRTNKRSRRGCSNIPGNSTMVANFASTHDAGGVLNYVFRMLCIPTAQVGSYPG
jgi:hypothetical protein